MYCPQIMTRNKNPDHPFYKIAQESLFIVWGPPSYGPRSKVFCKELGIEELHFIFVSTRRGLIAALYKYPFQALKTFHLLFLKKPKIVFVQNPPSIAVFVVFLYCALTGSQYLVDAHSAAFQMPYWVRPRWIYKLLARKALATIVTNEYFQDHIKDWGGNSFLLRDIPTTHERRSKYHLDDTFNITVINTFSRDEPIREVIKASNDLPEIRFNITGKLDRADPQIINSRQANINFTDFLPDKEYFELLDQSHAIICLTTRDNTMQRGACEALSMEKPIITSNWLLLQTYFHKGTVHVKNTSVGIRNGVKEMIKNYSKYYTEIKELRLERQHDWNDRMKDLVALLQPVLDSD